MMITIYLDANPKDILSLSSQSERALNTIHCWSVKLREISYDS